MQRPSSLDPCKDHQAWIHPKTIRPGSMQRPSSLDPCKDHQAWIHAETIHPKTIRPGSIQRPSGLDHLDPCKDHQAWVYVYFNGVFLTGSDIIIAMSYQLNILLSAMSNHLNLHTALHVSLMLQPVNTIPYISSYM